MDDRFVTLAGYQFSDRTLEIPSGLTAEDLALLFALLGRPAHRSEPYRGSLSTELTREPGADAVLRFLRDRRLAHSITDRWRWPPPPSRGLRLRIPRRPT